MTIFSAPAATMTKNIKNITAQIIILPLMQGCRHTWPDLSHANPFCTEIMHWKLHLSYCRLVFELGIKIVGQWKIKIVNQDNRPVILS